MRVSPYTSPFQTADPTPNKSDNGILKSRFKSLAFLVVSAVDKALGWVFMPITCKSDDVSFLTPLRPWNEPNLSNPSC